MGPYTFEQFLEQPGIRKSVSKYKSADEEKPFHEWWCLDKSRIHEILRQIPDMVAGVLKGIPTNDMELKRIYCNAKNLGYVITGSPIRVALLGPQGAGKSLLINALFDCDGLSLTGADGAACTSSIIKYSYDHTAINPKSERSFVADVRFLGDEKRDQIIAEHVRSFALTRIDMDTDDENEIKNASLGDDELERQQLDTAEEFFATVFGSSAEAQEAWACCGSDLKEFTHLCSIKCEGALKDHGVRDGVKRVWGKDQKDLLKQIKPFLTNVGDELCLWPLVDCVTILFDHELLREGIEIIDLPGSGDVNLSRVRHAEEIKDTVDVEIILGETGRIITNDWVTNSVRSGIMNRGPRNVKIVTTKIDQLSDHQLAQCSGKDYDHIATLMEQTDEASLRAEQDDDEDKQTQLGKYKTYLERYLKAKKVTERAQAISEQLAGKFRTDRGTPEVFHGSAADYMKWIGKATILYRDMPALGPELTGIPAIRTCFFGLPANRNLKRYMEHINTEVPAFVDKVRRVTSPADRDEGFRTIADRVDILLGHLMNCLHAQVKEVFHSYSRISIIEGNVSIFKKEVDKLVRSQWLTLRSPAFNRVLKSKGLIARLSSRAKGLEDGCHWNKDLARIFASSFRSWNDAYAEGMQELKDYFPLALGELHEKVISEIEKSAANLATVETAKRKWNSTYEQMQAKMMRLLDSVAEEQYRLKIRAIMEDERENSLVAMITDELYEAILSCEPGRKPTSTGKPGKYVMPKFKLQKKLMEELFMSPNDHFVDQLINKFKEQLAIKMNSLITGCFNGIGTQAKGYTDDLRSRAPINYDITSHGQALRSELAKVIPALDQKAAELSALFPKAIKQEGDSFSTTVRIGSDANAPFVGLQFVLDHANKKRSKNTSDFKGRIKKEGDRPAKKPRF